MSKTSAPAAEKSAAEALIERLAEKELKESINPMAIVKDEEVKGEKTDDGAKVVRRVEFANGAVLESYA